MNTSSCYLGLDIGKAKIHAYLLLPQRQGKRKVVDNTAAGHQDLLSWLSHQHLEGLHACLEATSTYGNEIAQALHQAGYGVSIANPKAVQAYAQSRMIRTKTDPVDARMIAEYCQHLQPRLWTPPAPEMAQLQQMMRRVQALEEMIVQEKNRQETVSPALADDIQAHIDFMEQQQKTLWEQIHAHLQYHPSLQRQVQLLDSIPGIGVETAARLVSEFAQLGQFKSARQLAAYAGITPQEKISGSSVHGKPKLSKVGNARLRKALFMPAMTLLRWNQDIQQWRETLLSRGKTKRQVVGAVMHKLIRWVFGVLHSGKPFDPAFAFPDPKA
jgi:transposase